MNDELPEGWVLENDELPEGWVLEEERPATPGERDEQKLRKLGEGHLPKEKTPEELEKMSWKEKLEYAREMNEAGEMIQSRLFVPKALSALTFGLSEKIPGLEVTHLEETSPYSVVGAAGDVVGSLVPLSGLTKIFAGPATRLAAKSPVLQKQLSSLATMFGVGVADELLHDLAKGEMPSTEELLEHGIEWAALDAGLQTLGAAGRFAKGLAKRSQETGMPRKELVNRIGAEAGKAGTPEEVAKVALEMLESPITEQEIQEARRLQLPKSERSATESVAEREFAREAVTPVDLKTRKIEGQGVNQLVQDARILSEPYELEGINFRKEAENLERDAIQGKIDNVGTRAASEEELGVAIREDIEAQLESRKAEYRPLYKQAEEAAQSMTHVPQNVAYVAGEKLRKMERLATKPSGYSSVLNTLEDALKDAGFQVQRSEGAIESIISKKSVPVEDTIELARRLNEIIDYEAVEPSVKDALKSVARAAKQDIRAGLAGNADALAAFELAEAAHAQTAKTYNRDSIRRIRRQQAGEKVSRVAEGPTALGELKETLSPKQYLQLEREMLEKLNTQSYEKAQKTLRDTERHMSEENRKLAREIVEAKNPHNPTVRNKLAQEAVLDDMSKAITEGSRPKKTLDLWKTSKGQKLVKDAFRDSPNWEQVKGYLEQQSFSDMVESVLKDGKLDTKKFDRMMSNPIEVKNIRDIGGEEAVNFFEHLSGRVKKLRESAKLLERVPSKHEIEQGRKFMKTSEGQQRLEKGVAEKQRVPGEMSRLGKEKLKIHEKPEKGVIDSKIRRGEKILDRMMRKDYPVQAKVNDWTEYLKDMLGLDSQAAMSVFGVAKLGGAAIGAWTVGVPSTVGSMIGYRMMRSMLTSKRVRQAFIEASRSTNPVKLVIGLHELGESLEEQ